MSVNQEVLSKALKWMMVGETGMSSLCIMATLLNGKKVCNSYDATAHPHDPADFRRCYLLLQSVPEFKTDLKKMSKVSPHWAALIERWDDVEKLYLSELPNRRCPETFKLMQQIYKDLDE